MAVPILGAQSQQDKVFRKDLFFEGVGYEPHEGQIEVHMDTSRHRVLCNGRRWGKTLLGGHEAEAAAFVLNRFKQPQIGWIVGPEFKDCEKEFRVLHDTFKALGIDKLSTKFLNNVDNGNMVIKTKWGFWVECRSAKHPETLVGEGLDFVIMVEAGRQKKKTWTEYIRPALSDKRGWSLHTGVPEGTSQNSLLYALWLRGQSRFIERNGRRIRNPWRSWRMPSWTNTIVFPGGRNDPEILEAEEDLTVDEFDRQYGAKFVERVGRVMAEWDDEVHLRDLKYKRKWPLYLAIDFGYTNDFVILFIQTDEFNNVHVIREKRYLHTDTQVAAEDALNDPELGPLIRASAGFYPDPHNPSDIDTLMRVWKKPRLGPTDGGEIKDRNALIRLALKAKVDGSPDRPWLFVDRRECTQLAWEMREGYRWPEHKSDSNKNDAENPLDKDNHGPEALSRFFWGHMRSHMSKRKSRQSKVRVRR